MPSSIIFTVAENENLTGRFLRNALYRIVNAAMLKVISLVAAPFIIHRLGPEKYTMFYLCLDIVTYFRFIDLGFGVAQIKFLSEFRARGRMEDGRMVVRLTMLMNTIAGAVGAVAVWIGSEGFLLPVFGGSPEAGTALKLVAAAFFVQMASGAFFASMQAAQRFDIQSIVETVSSIVLTGGFIAILMLGGTLIQMLEFHLLNAVVLAAVCFFIARAVAPEASFIPAFDARTFRLLFSYGFFSTIARAASLLAFRLDKYIISSLVTLAAASSYIVAFQLAQLILYVPSMLTPLILPAASELDARGEADRLRRLFVRGTKYLFVLSVPVAMILLIAPHQVIRFWIDSEYADQGWKALVLLAASHTVFSFTQAATTVVYGMGKTLPHTIFVVAAGLIDLALCLILVPKYGVIGAGWASVATMSITSPVFLAYTIAMVKPRWEDVAGERIGATVAALVPPGLFLYFARDYIVGRASLLAILAAFGVILFASLWMFKVAGVEEKLALQRLLRGRR